MIYKCERNFKQDWMMSLEEEEEGEGEGARTVSRKRNNDTNNK
tara:strand:+ start:602 stop:730 length:129 start_codon:yes stop_codon:yes gene_type:complete